MFRHRHHKVLFGFCETPNLSISEMQYPQGFSLSHHRDANVSGGKWFVQVLAKQAIARVFNMVHPAAPECPTTLARKDRLAPQSRTPGRDDFHQILRWLRDG